MEYSYQSYRRKVVLHMFLDPLVIWPIGAGGHVGYLKLLKDILLISSGYSL